MRLKELMEPGTFLYFLDQEMINLWDIDKSKTVLIRKASKKGLGLGTKVVKTLQGLLM